MLLSSAGDVEGRIDHKEQNAYLLDLARTFPPEDPRECSHLPRIGQTCFYRLLRPEFLQLLKSRGMNRLSSDGLTAWSDPEERVQQNRLLRAATRYLITTVIPDLAHKLNSDDPALGLFQNPVSGFIHARGTPTLMILMALITLITLIYTM